MEFLQEVSLRHRVQVEAVQESAFLNIFRDGLNDMGIVVPVVQGAGAGEEVDELPAVLIRHMGAMRHREYRGKTAAVGAHFGFEGAERRVIDHLTLH
jgi:hypothetical protein